MERINYYYQFKLQTPRYYYRIIIYKESAKYSTFNNRVGYYHEIRDFTSVLELLDLDVFFNINGRILYRELSETSEEFIYTFYTTEIFHGDFGMCDAANLSEVAMKVDKTTGQILPRIYTPLKSVVIPNTYHDFNIG